MLGLEQNPRVQELIEIARQEVLARAYNDQARASVPEPTQQAMDSYHDAHPELFSQRKVYMIQELILAPTTLPAPELRRLVAKATSMTALAESLKKEGVNFKPNQVTQPAENLPLDQLRGRRVTAVAGTARPGIFFDMLRARGIEPTLAVSLPDHAALSDYTALVQDKASTLLCTEKDAVKLFPQLTADRAGQHAQVWAVPLELTPEPAFFDALDRRLLDVKPRV